MKKKYINKLLLIVSLVLIVLLAMENNVLAAKPQAIYESRYVAEIKQTYTENNPTFTISRSTQRPIYMGDTIKIDISVYLGTNVIPKRDESGDTYNNEEMSMTVDKWSVETTAKGENEIDYTINLSVTITPKVAGDLTCGIGIKAGGITKIKINIQGVADNSANENIKKDQELLNKINYYYQEDSNKITTGEDRLIYIISCAKNDQWKKIEDMTSTMLKAWVRSIDEIDSELKKDNSAIIENLRKAANSQTLTDEEREAAESEANDTVEGIQTDIETNEDFIAMQIEGIIVGENRVEQEFNGVLDDISYYKPEEEGDNDTVNDMVSTILTVITNIGMVMAVLMSAILGVKYMLGSVEEKADYKKGMIPYFVGAILLFGICTIVKVLQQLGESINNI